MQEIKQILELLVSPEKKIELLERLMQDRCEKYKNWSIERDELILEAMELIGFVDDCTLTNDQLWERFIDHLKDTENDTH